MPAAKRARPSFSPPRPSKSKVAAKSTKPTTASDTTTSRKRGRPSTTSATTGPKRTTKTTKRRQRTPSPHNSSSAPSSPASQASLAATSTRSSSPSRSASPPTTTNRGPDQFDSATHLLVEVTTASTTPQPSIPLGLIHRIMLEHWQGGEKTKISGDAREVIGCYIETFVREAVVRCAFEAGERGERVGQGEVEGEAEKGWLDVEDLERVGGALVLDF